MANIAVENTWRPGQLKFSDDNSINARRRRQGAGGQGVTSGERASAPSRRRESGGGISGGGGPSGGSPGGSRPGGRPMPVWLIILLLVGYGLYSLFGRSGSPDSPPAEPPDAGFVQEAANPEPTATLRPLATRKPAEVSAAGQAWTVMLFADADDQVLEQDIYIDLNEVERVGSTDQVQIVAQVDRYQGGFSGDGDWVTARRYFIRQDADLTRLRSDVVTDLGEVNMADGRTLTDFIVWAAENYPADKYVLILSDHGMGWPGGWSDATATSRDSSRAPIVSQIDDNIYLMELDRALTDARKTAQIDRFEVVGMDACLMASLEVFSMLQQHARFAIASEETEPALGWAYTGFLSALVEDPTMDGGELSQHVVQTYIQDDQRIQDASARADFLRQGSPMGGLFGSSADISPATLANQLGRDITLSAVDLDAIPTLNDSLNALVYRLQSIDQASVASARDYARSFTNIFSRQGQPPYIDLGSFVQILKRENSDASVAQAADQVLSAIQNAVIAEKHGPNKKGSTGIAIYFPNSTLYRSPVAGPQSYTQVADYFSKISLWDDLLAFHYNDLSFQPNSQAAIIPQSSAPSRAPGQGQISISPLSASEKIAAPDQPITLSARIEGNNIGYIYLLVGYYDHAANSIFLADNDYLESSETREVDGLFYPKWGKGSSFNLNLEWEPTVFEISDGKTRTVALMNPDRYGVSAQEAVYTVDGTYTYSNDNTSRRARLYFQNGKLQHVFGFSDGEVSSAREIIPQNGDTFTILEKWLDLDSGGQVTGAAYQEGVALTFRDQPFTWQEIFAASGDYVVGFIVEDLDGNQREAYTQITVK